jgi:hypothetical protein|tara:strand:- start:174 stop:452 length:279 start_codon:yes stop_codon:yes gene_type:complete
MINFKTISAFSKESGYSEHAIRTKISRGVWGENEVWVRTPDNRVLINIEGFNEWAIKGQEFVKEVTQASSLPLHINTPPVENLLQAAPLNLT